MGNSKDTAGAVVIGIVVVVGIVVYWFSNTFGLDAATSFKVVLGLFCGVVVYGILTFMMPFPQRIALMALFMIGYGAWFPAMEFWGAVPPETTALAADPPSHWYMNGFLRYAGLVAAGLAGWWLGGLIDDK